MRKPSQIVLIWVISVFLSANLYANPLSSVSGAVVDLVATTTAMAGFYVGSGAKLCNFGKANFINLALAGTALGTSMLSERAEDQSTKDALSLVSGISSFLLGVINPIRGYFGIHYHFLGGMPLPGMPEIHNDFVVVGSDGSYGFEGSVFNLANHARIFREVTLGDALEYAGAGLFDFVLVPLTFVAGLIQAQQGLALLRY
jgi:hypothetical protein